MDLVLSLFPGIGLLDMAFEEHGFCIVRGPDQLWGGDIHRFHPPSGRFDGIIGGPPCQAFSAFRTLVAKNGGAIAANLIPEYERCVAEAMPGWFLMENVPNAPTPVVDGYAVMSLLLNNRWFGGEQQRVRRFSFGVRGEAKVSLACYLDVALFEHVTYAPTVCAAGGVKPGIAATTRNTRAAHYGWKTATALFESLRLQGLPADFLDAAPFTLRGKHQVIGNGVPLPMGRAIANAVQRALQALRDDHTGLQPGAHGAACL